MTKKGDLLLHPVRIRIIQELLFGKPMTVAQLVDKLGNVPQATLYRHMNLLLEAKVVEVVDTQKVQGTVERLFSVSQENLVIPEREIENASQEEVLRYLTAFHTSMLQQAEEYIMNTSPNEYAQDGFGFWQAPLYLTDEQFQTFSEGVNKLLSEVGEQEPGPGRSRKLFACIVIPQK